MWSCAGLFLLARDTYRSSFVLTLINNLINRGDREEEEEERGGDKMADHLLLEELMAFPSEVCRECEGELVWVAEREEEETRRGQWSEGGGGRERNVERCQSLEREKSQGSPGFI